MNRITRRRFMKALRRRRTRLRARPHPGHRLGAGRGRRAASATTRRWSACSCSAATTRGAWSCRARTAEYNAYAQLAAEPRHRAGPAAAGQRAERQRRAVRHAPLDGRRGEPVRVGALRRDRQRRAADRADHQGAVPARSPCRCRRSSSRTTTSRTSGTACAARPSRRPAGPGASPTCSRAQVSSQQLALNVSLSGNTLFQAGTVATPYVMGARGRDDVQRASAPAGTGTARKTAFQNVVNASVRHRCTSAPMRTCRSAPCSYADLVNAALAAAPPLTTAFPAQLARSRPSCRPWRR